LKTYDVFLFDADGTLFDYDKAEEHALKAMFDRCGFVYSENIRQVYRDINEKAWKDYENGIVTKTELQSVRFERLFDAMGVRRDAMEFNLQYLYELGKGSYLIDGAYEICSEIVSKGKKIYIVTNGIITTQESRIKHSLIKDYVTDFFVSEFVGYQKPQIEYFDYVFSHIQKVEKDKILIIGDSLSADIAGGNNAGIDSCWYNASGAANNTEIIPTYEIKSLYDVRMFA